MVFGTFDGLHLGHLNFFQQARALASNSFLIVSIARNVNIKKIKGSEPEFSEKKRLALVQKTKLAERVILGDKKEYLKHILKEKPNIIALGYDQKAYVRNLRKDLKDKNLKIKIIRLKSYKKNIYKNTLLKKLVQ